MKIENGDYEQIEVSEHPDTKSILLQQHSDMVLISKEEAPLLIEKLQKALIVEKPFTGQLFTF